MSFLSGIRNMFMTAPKAPAAPTAQQLIDLRAHARLKPGIDSIIWISSASIKNARLIDLSYGGAAIEFGLMDENQKTVPIEFNAVDRAINLSARVVYRRGNQAGFSFIHETPEGLIFLRDVIENMKSGSSLQRLPNSHLKEEYQSIGAEFWRGDGPADLQFFPRGFNGKASTSSLQLTFRDAKDYYQVAIGDGRIVTSKSRDFQDPEMHRSSNIMNTSRQIDLDILRKAAYVFCGINDAKVLDKVSGPAAEILAQFQSNLRLVR